MKNTKFIKLLKDVFVDDFKCIHSENIFCFKDEYKQHEYHFLNSEDNKSILIINRENNNYTELDSLYFEMFLKALKSLRYSEKLKHLDDIAIHKDCPI